MRDNKVRVEIEINKKLSKKQKFEFNKLTDLEKIRYVKSIMGNEYDGWDFRTLKTERRSKKKLVDILKLKGDQEILRLQNDLYNGGKTHTPKTLPKFIGEKDLGLWLGIEIECRIPCDTECTYDDPSDCDGDCSGCESTWDSKYNELVREIKDRKIKCVQVKSDGSINQDDEYKGFEFTCLTKITDMSNLKKLCELLKDFGAKVDKSCGLHVHLDVRDCTRSLDIGLRGTRLFNCLDILKNMVPNSRRSNTYCALKKSKTDRYSAINMCSVSEHSTIEVRLHSGTTDFNKIANWAKILYTISRSKLFTRRKPTDHTDFCAKLGLDADINTYIVERITKFANNTVEESTAA